MKIERFSLTMRELCDDYADYAEEGVVAYGGRTGENISKVA